MANLSLQFLTVPLADTAALLTSFFTKHAEGHLQRRRVREAPDSIADRVLLGAKGVLG
jgi:hypothetical protein